MKKTLLSLFLSVAVLIAFGQKGNPNNESSPNAPAQQHITKGSWNVQFNYSIPGGGSAGCETDGTNFYVTQWSGSKIWKLNSSGTLVDSFNIPGVSGLRDLAYDGTYFYGGASGNVIYKMDFTNKTLVGTISSPSVTVRNICYDPNADGGNGGFWVANWDTDLTLVSHSGTVLQTIPSSTHGQTSVYGSAYDTISPGGPYIWMINANSSVNTTVTQLDASTGVPTGLQKDLTTNVCNPGEIGGGLFIHPDIITGTTTLGGLIQNVSLFGIELETTIPYDYDLDLNSVNLSTLMESGQSVSIAGVVSNEGNLAVTSFDVNYKVDNGTVITENITGVNIASYSTYNFTHSTPWTVLSGSHIVDVWVSNPNGNTDEYNGNDKISTNVFGYSASDVVQRMPLHEAFTSSTCGPCVAGNANLSTVFNANPNKWVCIKYQMSWPGSGDPYYTDEGGDRRTYYGVTSVPNLKVDGGHEFDGNSSNYSVSDLNNAYNEPAFVNITATLNVIPMKKAVEVDFQIENNIPLSPTARVYVAILEKKTTQNVGSNGETEFDWVMKKMLPNGGVPIGPKPAGDVMSDTYIYLFNGNYRLPSSANNPINHDVEHSVEEFSDLIAVVWVQDYETAEVYQAAYSSVTVGLQQEISDMELNMYPNPVAEVLNVSFKAEGQNKYTISMMSNSGQLVYEKQVTSENENKLQINTSEFAEGIYFVKIQNDNGHYTKPILIKH